jgi:hypothetical protein
MQNAALGTKTNQRARSVTLQVRIGPLLPHPQRTQSYPTFIGQSLAHRKAPSRDECNLGAKAIEGPEYRKRVPSSRKSQDSANLWLTM